MCIVISPLSLLPLFLSIMSTPLPIDDQKIPDYYKKYSIPNIL